MNKIQERMIKKALGVHKRIFPCKGKSHFDECFTVEGRKIIFWFNTEDQTTHIIFEKLRSAENN
jgi:hypothetical protein